jgi:3-mercaptopyruvate sulfurtransferase SseA
MPTPPVLAVEVTGFEPSADQEALFREITDPNAKVSVVSGTGMGKTAAFARIALWHLLCFPVAVYDGKVEVGSNTYI